MRQNRDIRDVYYTVPETRVYESGEGRGLIRRRYTAGARIPMAVALQFGMPGAEERAPTPGGVIETAESTSVDPANSDAGEASADNVTGTGDVNSTDTVPVNSTDTDPFEPADDEPSGAGFDTGDLPPDEDGLS